eukprot:15351430-Ditylum_brightwellii.AAC.1
MSHHLCQIKYSTKNNVTKQQELKVCHVHLTKYDKKAKDTTRCTVGEDTELISSMSAIQKNAAKEVTIVMPHSESEPKGPKKDLKREWDKAMKKPLSTLEACFGSLKLNTRPVVVSKPCVPKVVEVLHKALQKIDSRYDTSIREASHLREMTDLCQYIQLH